MATVRIQLRRGTAAEWTAANPILAAGEAAIETDTNAFKFGDGTSHWNDLDYALSNTVDDYIALTEKGQATGVATLDGNGQVPLSQLGLVVNGAPELLNTLDELAQALGDDANFATTMTNQLAGKASLNGASWNVGATVVLPADTTIGSVTPTRLTYINSLASNAQTQIDNLGTDVTSVTTNFNNHKDDTTSVHGIADTTELATKTFAQNEVSTHSTDTTNIHGIADTSLLATKTYAQDTVNTHNQDTTSVHGIADTGALATLTNVSDAQAAAELTASNALGSHESDTTSVHGIADTSLLATKTYADTAVSTHNSDETNVHGIADMAALATKSYVDTADALKAPLANPTFTGTVTLPANTISQSMMSDDSVGTNEIGGLAVTTGKIADLAVTTGKIADLGVTEGKIAALAVTNAKIATNAITAEKIDSGAVTSAKIANDTIVNANINSAAAIATSKIDGLDTALSAKAPLASPALTGTPTAPLAATGTNTTQLATTSFVQQEISVLTTGAPGLLNTLDELAAALGDDANYAATVTTALTAKAPLASPTFTGTVTLPTGTVTSAMILDGTIVDGDVNASAAIAQSKISGLTTDLGLKAPKADPTFTGTVTVASAGIAFTDGTQTKEGVPSRTVIGTAIGATYNLSTGGLTLRDQLIPISGAYAVTVPTNATTAFPIGTTISFYQSAGTDGNFVEASGVTILRTPGLKLRALYSSASLTKVATDTWLLAGDLKA